MIKRFARYYKPHLTLFIIDLFCAFLVAICNLVYPEIARNIVNIYVPDKNINMILILGGVLLGVYIIKCILNYVIQYWGHIVGVRIQADMRRDLFKKLQKLPFTYYDKNKTGYITSRMVNDLMDISELAHHGPEDVFLSVITMLGAFIMLSITNIYLALIVFAIIPFILVFEAKTTINGMIAKTINAR